MGKHKGYFMPSRVEHCIYSVKPEQLFNYRYGFYSPGHNPSNLWKAPCSAYRIAHGNKCLSNPRKHAIIQMVQSTCVLTVPVIILKMLFTAPPYALDYSVCGRGLHATFIPEHNALGTAHCFLRIWGIEVGRQHRGLTISTRQQTVQTHLDCTLYSHRKALNIKYHSPCIATF